MTDTLLSRGAIKYSAEFTSKVHNDWHDDVAFILGEALMWRGYVEQPSNDHVLYEIHDRSKEQLRIPEKYAQELMSYARKKAEQGFHTI